MTITFNGTPVELPRGETLLGAVERLSPYDGEPVAVVYNGVKIESHADRPLSEGDDVTVFLLLMGG